MPLRVALLLTFVLLAAGCTGDVPPRPPQTPVAPTTTLLPFQIFGQTLQGIADRRAKAMLAGDEQGWLAEVHPSAQDVERMRFRNLRQLRPSLVKFFMDTFSSGGFPAGSAFPDGARKFDGQMTVVLQLPTDVAPTSYHYDYQWVQVAEKLSIFKVEPFKDGKTPWDLYPLKTAQIGNITIAAKADSPWNPASYTANAKKADTLVRGLWGKRKSTKGFLILLGHTSDKMEWFNAGQDPTLKFARGYVYAPFITDAATGQRKRWPTELGVYNKAPEESMAGGRIVLDLDLLQPRDVYKVMAHEMAHSIAPNLMAETNYLESSPQGIFNKPTWVIEGFAEWVELLASGDLAARQALIRKYWSKYRPADTLPPNAGFYHADQNRTIFNYQVSMMFFLAAERLGGKQKVVQMYEYFVIQQNFTATNRIWLDGPLRQLGLNPQKFWTTYRGLVG